MFINNVAEANISIMHLQGEIDFAGVAALAAAWLLTQLRGRPTRIMRGRGGDIRVWQNNDVTWVSADLSAMPPWNYKKIENPEAVERLTLNDTKAVEHTMFWAWANKDKGLIRARTFAADWEIPEAEGNGSGALVLAAKLGRPI